MPRRRQSPRTKAAATTARHDNEDDDASRDDDNGADIAFAAAAAAAALPENARVVAPKYLQKHSSQKDLVRRLTHVAHVLRTDHSIDVMVPTEWPGVDALAPLLVTYLSHGDKQTRLLSVVCCNEMFGLYAPTLPWSDAQVLHIFAQTATQLASLAQSLPNNSNYPYYVTLLESLAEIKSPIVLADLVRKEITQGQRTRQYQRKIAKSKTKKQGRSHKKNDDDDDEHDSDVEAMLATSSSSEDDDETMPATMTTTLSAQEILADLFYAVLHCTRPEHSAVLHDRAATVCDVTLNEFASSRVPCKLLDDLLSCLVEQETTPAMLAAALKKAPSSAKPLLPVQQGAAYQVAVQVLRQGKEHLQTQISQTLNGVLCADPHVLSTTSLTLETVHDIIVQLQAVLPAILTTVLGTMQNDLVVEDADKRIMTVKTLGKLFGADPSTAAKYSSLFVGWLQRHRDVNVEVRVAVLEALPALLPVDLTVPATAHPEEVVHDALAAWLHCLTADPSLDVREVALHSAANYVFRGGKRTPVLDQHVPWLRQMMQAIGSRVAAKHKPERRNALVALANIYFKHYMTPKLKPLEQALTAQEGEGGKQLDDNLDMGMVLKSLHSGCLFSGMDNQLMSARKHGRRKGRRPKATGTAHEHDDDPFSWIPSKVLTCLSYTDQVDSGMRSEVLATLDDVLLGKPAQPLTATSRAVGLTMILDSLAQDGEALLETGGTSDAFKFLRQALEHRARLQKLMRSYIETRTEIQALRGSPNGGDAVWAANSKAMQLLRSMAALTPADDGGGSIEQVLAAFHAARDKRIFQSLALLSSPTHSMAARVKVLDEIGKRTTSLGHGVSDWAKALVKRCSMGSFLSVDGILQCVVLAQECFLEQDLPACAALLVPVKLAAGSFPELCGHDKTFVALTELFTECRSTSNSNTKLEVAELGVLSALSQILSASACARGESKSVRDKTFFAEDAFQELLINVCTRDGTPEQARNAAYTLARMSDTDAGDETLLQLFKQLTSASRLSFGAKHDKNSKTRIVSTLCALSALVDSKPNLFVEHDPRRKVVTLALDGILLASGSSDGYADDDSETDSEDKTDTKTPLRRGRLESTESSADRKHRTPEATQSLVDDESLSFPCRRICSAIDFLVTCIRSHVTHKSSGLSIEQIGQVFTVLVQIVRAKGMPPSNRDRKGCQARQDRAALRQCAAVHLLRLCDSRLGLEKTFLSTPMWLALGEAFLDEELVVREAVIEEFGDLLKGTGLYQSSSGGKSVPSLRFFAYVVLCANTEGGNELDTSNASAANVGKKARGIVIAAEVAASNLRKACDVVDDKNLGESSPTKKRMDTKHRVRFVPDYAVPFAAYLLSFRRETPVDDDLVTSDEGDANSVQDSEHRVLRKRLRLLFEPIIGSIGGNNVAFLLDMIGVIGSNYMPVTLGEKSTNMSPATLKKQASSTSAAKLLTVSSSARDVLRSFVKTDKNLSAYPGEVQVPTHLFVRRPKQVTIVATEAKDRSKVQDRRSFEAGTPTSGGSKRAHSATPGSGSSKRSKVATAASVGSEQANTRPSSIRKSLLMSTSSQKSIDSSIGSPGSAARQKSRVHFSPDLRARTDAPKRQRSTGQEVSTPASFDGMSPIAKSASPALDTTPVSFGPKATATLGSTPPSDLKTATQQSDGVTDQEDEPSVKVGIDAVEHIPQSDLSRASSDELLQTTSEPFSSQESNSRASSRRSTRKRVSPQAERQRTPVPLAKRAKTKALPKEHQSKVPVQIKIGRSSASIESSRPRGSSKGSSKASSKSRRATQKRGAVDDFDFDSDQENSQTLPAKSKATAEVAARKRPLRAARR